MKCDGCGAEGRKLRKVPAAWLCAPCLKIAGLHDRPHVEKDFMRDMRGLFKSGNITLPEFGTEHRRRV